MHTLRIYSIRYLIISSLALTVSCADISIPPPSPKNPTLLVLPANLNNETAETEYQFSYAYEIVGDFDGAAVPTLRVEFVLPVKPGMSSSIRSRLESTGYDIYSHCRVDRDLKPSVAKKRPWTFRSASRLARSRFSTNPSISGSTTRYQEEVIRV